MLYCPQSVEGLLVAHSYTLQAGYEVILPEDVGSTCCGMMFNSRGFAPAANHKMSDLEQKLLKASDNGKIPIVCDTSPCLMQVRAA